MPFQPRQVHGNAGMQIDARHVARTAGADARDLLPCDDDALGEQEAHSQLEVVAGCAHRDRNGAVNATPADVATQADLQRLLNGQLVRRDYQAGGGTSAHADGGQGQVVWGIDFV